MGNTVPNASIELLIAQAKRVIVLGFGTTGQAATNFFLHRKIPVTVIEKQGRDSFLIKPSNKKLVNEFEKAGVVFSFSDVVPEAVMKKSADPALCVISPGIPHSSSAAEKIKQIKIPIIGELELGLGLCDVNAIMVTGSNGKSTCVSLMHAIFEYAGKKSFLCGNIGQPVLTLLDEEEKKSRLDVLVVEASSYQLESAKSIHPKVAVILNLSENHLERHGTMEGYLQAKKMIAANQIQNDFTVLNGDDPKIFASRNDFRSTLAFFGQDAKNLIGDSHALIQYDPLHKTDRIEITLAHEADKIIFDCSQTKLLGEHARYNIAAAALSILLFAEEKKSPREWFGRFKKRSMNSKD